MPDASPSTDDKPATRAPAWAAYLGLLLGAAALVVSVWFMQRTDGIGREAARRLQASDARVAQLDAQLKQSQDLLRDLQGRSAVLESKLSEAIGQQSQLEKMYRDIATDSMSAVLGDVENQVGIASQQLLVSGNVAGALVALQDADGRLKRVNQPNALGLRRLLGRDIERLRAVPTIDVVGLALRLDSVMSAVDHLPLLSSVRPNAAPAAREERKPVGPEFSLSEIASTGRRGWQALTAELGQLFRVNRVDSSDALLLAPDQAYFLRQNLRLTLLAARISLLSRSQPLFRADLDHASHWLSTYYDRHDKGVANALATLRQLQGARISVELPSLGDLLAAVRAARAADEAAR